MKIVSVLTTSADGGAEFAAGELLDALAGRGHEVVLLTNAPHLGRDRSLAVRPIDLGPKLSRSTYRGLLVRLPALAVRLRRALAEEAPFDALLLHFKKEQLLALALPRRRASTLLWAEWGPVPEPLRRGVANLVYRLAARRADVLLAVSEGTRQSLVDAGIPARKVVVLPNAVRTDRIRFDPEGRLRVRDELGIPHDAFVVGCVSRFHPKKRNDVVVEAVKLLDGDTHLILAGAGETEDELREQARALGARAHFIPTPTTEIAQVLSAFDVSVFCPSPTEGAPRAVILAMLAERPVVATGAEGVRDLLPPEAGVILERENDPRALAAALDAYARDRDLLRHHGSRARRIAEAQHGASAVAERLERLLASSSPAAARLET